MSKCKIVTFLTKNSLHSYECLNYFKLPGSKANFMVLTSDGLVFTILDVKEVFVK